ncbi:MAG: PTS fructose transporter subunit IIA [Nitrospinota bacterium]|nr:PTS fructose transporter subunit IIA [Nitrospinota bacterium]MDH5677038.1 PTS fructose transporter subunit IIA [Nitrospinota bacterium]MDH5755067.1 PTS fructose transporter subunit IIA [Nitrospinota bacterium]
MGNGEDNKAKPTGHLLIAHGALAGEMLSALEFISGKRPNYQALAIDHALDVDRARRIVEDAVDKLMGQTGVLVFTDLFGGAPSNIALSLLEEKNIEIIAGVNLPMLLHSTTLADDMPLAKRALVLREYGRENIFIASEVLSGKKK